MIDTTSQGEEALVAVCDIGFNLFRRHPRIKGCNDDYRNVDFGKEINRHPCDSGCADYKDHKAEHQNKKGVFDRKGRHYLLTSDVAVGKRVPRVVEFLAICTTAGSLSRPEVAVL